jgi:hypothetical protein
MLSMLFNTRRQMEVLKRYVDYFNENDQEIYKNLIDNKHAYDWLRQEIPLLECPDKDIERTYYFRYWTYRKHIKLTEDGYVITEFLPRVPWSGKHNVINAPTGHHIYEGRWLKSGNKYLSDYIDFILDTPDCSHRYSTWLCYAILKWSEVNGERWISNQRLDKLCRYYEIWEERQRLSSNGMFWSIDDRDAMEFSISGTTRDHKLRRGIRPTLNSYMCADAYAIAQMACALGDKSTYEKYIKKHNRLANQINEVLYEDGFYRAIHFDGEDVTMPQVKECPPREELGYIPWMFGIPPKGRESAFDLLTDKNIFYSEFGITTAEQNHERFLYAVGHECLWNGYVWPYATAQTLTALINVIDNYSDDEKYKKLFFDLLLQYAKTHQRVLEDGTIVPWIDEVRHPYIDDWSSRTVLENWGWREDKGGYERGKDYNHSTFCDLVISGLVGVKSDREELYVKPNIPKDWEWFKLSNLNFRGSTYTVIYDKNGSKYGVGKGLIIQKQ